MPVTLFGAEAGWSCWWAQAAGISRPKCTMPLIEVQAITELQTLCLSNISNKSQLLTCLANINNRKHVFSSKDKQYKSCTFLQNVFWWPLKSITTSRYTSHVVGGQHGALQATSFCQSLSIWLAFAFSFRRTYRPLCAAVFMFRALLRCGAARRSVGTVAHFQGVIVKAAAFDTQNAPVQCGC